MAALLTFIQAWKKPNKRKQIEIVTSDFMLTATKDSKKTKRPIGINFQSDKVKTDFSNTKQITI